MNLDLTAYVTSFPKEGGEAEVRKLLLSPGGSAANTAVALRRLGLDVGLISCVGNDVFGEFLRGDLRKEGVGTAGIQGTSHALTGLVFVLVSQTGERTMHAARGANRYLRFSPVHGQLASAARIFHLSGHALLDRPQSDTARELLEKLPRDELVSMDVGLMAASRGVGFLTELLVEVDYLFLSSEEERLLFGSAQDGPPKLLRLVRKAVVVRRGPEGCTVWHDGQVSEVSAPRVKAVDTTGAGDAFDAGFLFGVVKGWEIRKCAELGNAVAALKIRRPGTRAGLPSYNEVLKFIRDRKEGNPDA